MDNNTKETVRLPENFTYKLPRSARKICEAKEITVSSIVLFSGIIYNTELGTYYIKNSNGVGFLRDAITACVAQRRKTELFLLVTHPDIKFKRNTEDNIAEIIDKGCVEITKTNISKTINKIQIINSTIPEHRHLIESKGIYAIFNNDTDEIYIGMTTTSFIKRWIAHHINNQVPIVGLKNTSFAVLEVMDDSSYEEILDREEEYIKKYRGHEQYKVLNKYDRFELK